MRSPESRQTWKTVTSPNTLTGEAGRDPES